jgi:predicted anti-sigma-YlaC factor YlaD
VNHDDVRESISARLDGEPAPLTEAEIADHLRGCAECRSWASAVSGIGLVAAAEPPAQLTEQVLRAVSTDLTAAGGRRRQELWLRVGLLAVGVVQLVLAVPVLIFGHDHSAPLHVAHELGSFDAAVGLGMLAAARRPRVAAGMVPLVAAITALLMITAGSDLAAGRTDVLDEAPHLLDLVGFLLLRRLSVVDLSGPSGPPALLVPLATGPRPARGAGPRVSMAVLRPAAAGLALAAKAAFPVVRGALRRLVLVVGAALLTVAGVAGPASAHVVHQGDDPTNWRSTVIGLSPPVSGVTAAIAEAGQRIGLTNVSGRPVVVLGYSGEPFLQLSRGLVEANTRSATAHSVVPGLPGPSGGESAVAPSWRVIARATTWWWHDPRTHFDGLELPPQVVGNAGHLVHYATWRVGLVVDGRPSAVVGSLDWVPSRSSSGPWLLGAALLLATAGIGWLRRWSRPLIVALVAVTAADVVHAVAGASARVGSAANHLAALPGHGVLIGAVWLVAAAACYAAWHRRSAAAYLGLLAAGVTVMVDALPSAGVLWHSQADTTLSHTQAGALVAAVIGAGAGTSIACVALMLRLDPAPKRDWVAPAVDEHTVTS